MKSEISLGDKHDYPNGAQNRPYEFEAGNEASKEMGRRDAYNKYFGLMTGRDYSIDKMENYGLTVKQIAMLQNLRFAINGALIVGRDILGNKNEITRDTIKTAIAYGIENKPKQNHPMSFVEGDYTLEVWYSKQGKRTWRGNDISDSGEVPARGKKIHYRNQGKRNRRTMGF
jgi:hypothetical protein